MIFSFKKKPPDLCKTLLLQINLLEQNGKEHTDNEKVQSKAQEILEEIRKMLYGGEESQPKMSNIRKFRDELTKEEIQLVNKLLKAIPLLNVASRSEVVKIVNFFVYRGKQNDFINFMLSHRDIFDHLIEGLENEQSAPCMNAIICECLKHKNLAEIFLTLKNLKIFIRLALNTKTDLAMEGFKALSNLFTKHHSVCVPFLLCNYETIVKGYFYDLLDSENYFAIIKMLLLLYKILSHHKSKELLMIFLKEVTFLVCVMNLMRSDKRNLQIAAFNLFKLFLGNSEKTDEIKGVLANNKYVLIDFLEKFTIEDDANFLSDKMFLLDQLDQLEEHGSGKKVDVK